MDLLYGKMRRHRMMKDLYEIAGHCFCVTGSELCEAVRRIDGFAVFAVEGKKPSFHFTAGDTVPSMEKIQYSFRYDDVEGRFGRYSDGYILTLIPDHEDPFHMWCSCGDDTVMLQGNWSMRLYRFALWVGFGLMTVPSGTVAIHSSCIVKDGKAVLFLGESGTGKSTHTRLWREHIDGAFLLNDDSPVIRVEDGKIWAYGSPWSGKTPCYKAERYELAACVRLSQAPENHIRKLPVLHAYGAIHPSCPPEFAYDDALYDHISCFIGKMLSSVPFYHLECLPDEAAARLAFNTIFSE